MTVIKTIITLVALLPIAHASALVSLGDSSTQPGAIIATETAIGEQGVVLKQSKANETSINAAYGWGLREGYEETFYVRLDLDNARFGSSVNAQMITDEAASEFKIIKGGGAGENFIVISVSPAVFIEIEPDIKIDFGLDTTGSAANLKINNRSDVNATYAMYQTEEDALSSSNALAESNGNLIQFHDALVIKGGESHKNKLINSAASALKFIENGGACVEQAGSLCSAIMNVTFRESDASTVAPSDLGFVIKMGDILSGATLEVKGDFKAVSKVYLDNTKFDCSANNLSAEFNPPKALASFSIDQFIRDEAVICIQVDGQTKLSEGAYTAKLIVNPRDGFNVPTLDISGDVLTTSSQ